MRRVLFIAILSCCIAPSFGQNSFLSTDLMGYSWPLFVPKDVRSTYGPRITIRYETGIINRHLSVAISATYGHTPAYDYNTYVYEPPTAPAYSIVDVTKEWRGFYLYPEVRYYPLFKMDQPAAGGTALKGLFVGVYGGIMYLREMEYARMRAGATNPNQSSSTLISYHRSQVTGVGLTIGYKLMVKNKFFIEALVGEAYGWGDIDPISNDQKLKNKQLQRLELMLGYAF